MFKNFEEVRRHNQEKLQVLRERKSTKKTKCACGSEQTEAVLGYEFCLNCKKLRY